MKISVLMALLLSAGVFISCQKGNSEGETTQLKVRMTDNPFNASEVNIDIREVRVKFSDDSADWISLNTIAGVYNLLGLQNGVDTLIAQGTVPAGSVKEIRFILGDDNDIVIDNVTYPLTIPSGSESGLKLKINKQLHGPFDSLLIDFDAALSIHRTGNGEYKLKPVLKIK